MGSTQQTQTSNLFSIFCRSEKKVYFSPFLSCFYVYFGVLCVNIGHVQVPKNISSKRNQILKILDQFFWISKCDFQRVFPNMKPVRTRKKSKRFACLFNISKKLLSKPKICSIVSLLPKRPKKPYFLDFKKELLSPRGIDQKFSHFRF